MSKETDLSRDRNEELAERFRLSGERLEQIAGGEPSDMEEAFKEYFRKTALLLTDCRRLAQKIREGEFSAMTLEELQAENSGFFREIMPDNYEGSYANPDHACSLKAHGREIPLRSFRKVHRASSTHVLIHGRAAVRRPFAIHCTCGKSHLSDFHLPEMRHTR